MDFEKYFAFLSLGDTIASADKKKSEIGSRESILILFPSRHYLESDKILA